MSCVLRINESMEHFFLRLVGFISCIPVSLDGSIGLAVALFGSILIIVPEFFKA